jgi:prophage regulatory protein
MSNHIVRPKDLVKKTGLSRSTLRRMEIAGTLPPRVKLGTYCVGWHSTDVDAWLNSLPRAQQVGDKP